MFGFLEVPKLHLDGLFGKKIRVRAGEPINIVIPLSGAPTPKIEWFKGNTKIAESYRVSVNNFCFAFFTQRNFYLLYKKFFVVKYNK